LADALGPSETLRSADTLGLVRGDLLLPELRECIQRVRAPPLGDVQGMLDGGFGLFRDLVQESCEDVCVFLGRSINSLPRLPNVLALVSCMVECFCGPLDGLLVIFEPCLGRFGLALGDQDLCFC